MTIFVYEQDPLIRQDIIETLENGLGTVVRPVMETDAIPVSDSALYILSMSRVEVQQKLQSLLSKLPKQRTVLISGDVPEESTKGVGVLIAKPFGADNLLSAARRLLGNEDECSPA